MARRRAARARQQETVEDTQEQPVVAEEPTSIMSEGNGVVTPTTVMPGVSKAAAMRAALAEGLQDNGQIIAFARERFGVELNPKAVSMFKSLEKRKAQGGGSASPRVPVRGLSSRFTGSLESEVVRSIDVVVEAAKQVGGIEKLRDIANRLGELL